MNWGGGFSPANAESVKALVSVYITLVHLGEKQ
jgi:hypothetical protein